MQGRVGFDRPSGGGGHDSRVRSHLSGSDCGRRGFFCRSLPALLFRSEQQSQDARHEAAI